MRRLVHLAVGLAVATSLFSVLSLPGVATAAADDVLDVPAEPSGGITVTANVPVADAPYLQVVFQGGSEITLSAAVRLPVVANAGPGTEVPVETWGLSGSATFGLVRCANEDPSSCTTLLGPTVTRTVIQMAPASAVIEMPSGTVFAPEDTVSVTARNDGGGRMVAWFRPTDPHEGTTTSQVLPRDVSTAVDLTGQQASYGTLSVKRCSPYTVDVCESGVSRGFRLVSVVRAKAIPDRSILPTDPELGGGTFVTVLGPNALRHDVSWWLTAPDGTIVLPEVAAASGVSNPFLVWVDPIARVGNLPEGRYGLHVRMTVHDGDRSRSGETSVPVTLLDDPPEPETPLLVSSTPEVRAAGASDIKPARWEVELLPRGGTTALWQVLDHSGDTVAEWTVLQCYLTRLTCSGNANFATEWRGYCDNVTNSMQPPGTYTVQALMPDEFGRMVTVPLGTVDLWRLERRERRVRPLAAPVRTTEGSSVGKCSAAPRPGPAGVRGSVGMLSNKRCASREGDRDVVTQRFVLRVPDFDGELYRMDSLAVQHRVASVRGHWGDGVAFRTRMLGERLPTRRTDDSVPIEGTFWLTLPAWERHALSGLDPRGKRIEVVARVARGSRVDVRALGLDMSYYPWSKRP